MKTTHLRSHFVPPRVPSDKRIIVLHGRGDSHAGFLWLPEALGLPDVGYLLLDAPDRWYMGLSWYGMPPDQLPGVLRSRELLDATFAELDEQGLDPAQTALFGFSQGCLLTLEWGARQPRPLAAFVGISGYVLDTDALLAERQPHTQRDAWLFTHGEFDDVVPFGPTADQVEALQAGGWPITFEGWPKDHTILPEELVRIRQFLAERLG